MENYFTKLENDDFCFYNMCSETSNKETYEKHMHPHYELYYFLSNDADYIVGNTLYHLKPYDLLFIRPTIYHCLKILHDNPYHRVVVYYRENHIDNAVLTHLNQINVAHYRIPQENKIHQYFKNGTEICNRYNTSDSRTGLLHLLNLILTELQYCNCHSDSKTHAYIHPILSKILAYIDENLNLPINTRTLSEIFFISPSWITHSFRNILDISPTEYINRKKIFHAQKLIAAGNPAMEVAQQIGYNNYTTFFIQYKRILGVSPVASKLR